MKRFESLKRILVLWMNFIGLLMQTAVYAYIWFEYYYPLVNGYQEGRLGLKFYRNGHFGACPLSGALVLFYQYLWRFEDWVFKAGGCIFVPAFFRPYGECDYICPDFPDAELGGDAGLFGRRHGTPAFDLHIVGESV